MRELLQRAGTTSDRGLRAMVGLCTATVLVVALYMARPVFAPLAFALFIIAIVWPFQLRLQGRLPRLVALAVSILATIVVIIAFGSMITWGFSRVARYVISDAGRFQLLYEQTAAWLEGHGIMVAGLWAEHFNVGWLIRLFQQAPQARWLSGPAAAAVRYAATGSWVEPGSDGGTPGGRGRTVPNKPTGATGDVRVNDPTGDVTSGLAVVQSRLAGTPTS